MWVYMLNTPFFLLAHAGTKGLLILSFNTCIFKWEKFIFYNLLLWVNPTWSSTDWCFLLLCGSLADLWTCASVVCVYACGKSLSLVHNTSNKSSLLLRPSDLFFSISLSTYFSIRKWWRLLLEFICKHIHIITYWYY